MRAGHTLWLGDVERARLVLGSRDFRRLFAARVVSQVADGIFLAAVLLTVVFLPERQSTVRGFALATALLLVPFSVLGPFAGVFIDRWRRRRILTAVPLARSAASLLTLPGTSAVVLSYVGALVVFSANRLFLATVTAVIPPVLRLDDSAATGPRSERRRGPDRSVADGALLFDANTVMAIGGATAVFVGLFAGGQLASRIGVPAILGLACSGWCLAALLNLSLSTGLSPQRPPTPPLGSELITVLGELRDGLRCIRDTPAALVPILAVATSQFLQMVVIVVSLVVFKESVEGGLVSFSWILATGGVGVFLGFVTVGPVGRRMPRRRLIGVAFVLAAAATVPAILALSPATLALGSVPMGMSYAWIRVPSDTLAQRAVPDRYRGRVFTVMDLGFNGARVLGAAVAVPLVPLLGLHVTLIVTACLFLLAAPIAPLWLGAGRTGAGRTEPEDTGRVGPGLTSP